ncbi:MULTISPECIES: hypothetical protein [unclassified Streptomyces]|uniref:hypothetical protein n=1 Tax=unclassified Streptomyces TaxID=2593676 RepID=UPI0009A0F3E7|nr:hypothetical protein [Streptomyces sp. CB01580]
MTEVNRLLLAAAVAGGYVLGRTKKGRLALTLVSYAAGRHYGVEPRKLMSQGMRRLGEIPQVADLGGQLRGELMAAGREAVSAAAERRLSSLAGSLHERTLQLEGGDEEEDRDEEDLPQDEAEGEEEDLAEEEQAPEGRRRAPRTAGASGGKPASRATGEGGKRTAGDRRQGGAGKTAPSRKPTARRRTDERAAPKKRAPSAEKASPRAERRR